MLESCQAASRQDRVCLEIFNHVFCCKGHRDVHIYNMQLAPCRHKIHSTHKNISITKTVFYIGPSM